MNAVYVMKKGNPYPLGASRNNKTINFAVVANSKEECGVLLYEKASITQGTIRIPFSEEHRVGNIYCGQIGLEQINQYEYNFYIGNQIVVDPYAKVIYGNEIWGGNTEAQINSKKNLTSGFQIEQYDWEKDQTLQIPYSESVFYGVHVRGFTKHSSSKVKAKGTFLGLIEKIPYLKELGITAIELMPAYEFEEVEIPKDTNSMEYMVAHYKEVLTKNPSEVAKPKINYWGYKKGYYYAPKASYAYSTDVVKEFKDMVKELHKNGIELIMQFFFPNEVKQGYILEVLKYWVLEYHIDGIHLKGDHIPVTLLGTEPLFSNTKLIYSDFPLEEIYSEKEIPAYRNLACYQDYFMYDLRKFLKGDEDMLRLFLYHTKKNPAKMGIINFITNYYGFTLSDLVSYDQKHNLENGEDNNDGNNYNYSWNCGVEGPSKKKAIKELRLKQMKNALIFVFLAQGTPLIMCGDEFGHTQRGNNNPYCQDNDITWINWNLQEKQWELYEFTKELILLRKNHPILRKEDEFRMMDTLSCGYPDLSYHSEEAWRVTIDNYSRYAGILYCGKYATINRKEEDFFYIAYNMHWNKHQFAIPKLPHNLKWEKIIDTSNSEVTIKNREDKLEMEIITEPRSIQIYKSIRQPEMSKVRTKNKK